MAEIFDLFEVFVIFVSKQNLVDSNEEYKETLHGILNCILEQFRINPVAYQHILPVNALIGDHIRLQCALNCLVSILTMSTSVASNRFLVQHYDRIVGLLLDICSRNKTPNSFRFKNDFKAALVCLDFMLEHLIAG